MKGKYKWINLGQETLWYLSVVGIYGIIWGKIQAQYGGAVGDIDSLQQFHDGLLVMMTTLLALAFLWWRAANINVERLSFIRRFLERHSFFCSFIPIGLAFLTSFGLYLQDHLIYSADWNHIYSLDCIFVMPLVFSGVIYALPPLQIARVILPGRATGVLRVLVATALISGAFALFSQNFF